MPHSISLWRAILSAPNGPVPLAPGIAGDEIPSGEDRHDEVVAELMRRYPGLSRALAEYLAR